MKKRMFSLLLGAVAALSFLFPQIHAAWLIGNGFSNSVSVSKNTSLIPVCYNARTNDKYLTISAAMADAAAGDTVYAYPAANREYEETSDIVINNNKKLILPWQDNNTWDSPSSDSALDALGNSRRDTSTGVATYRMFNLKMRSGADIRIESGSYLYIGGEFSVGGNAGYYTEINLGSGSSITCSGTIYCYGYIKENSADFVNYSHGGETSLTNASDSGRFLKINNGGALYSYMALTNPLTGGTLATCIQGGKSCPFWTYDFPGLQTFTEFVTGATFYTDSVMKVGTMYGRGQGQIVGNSSSNALFKMSSGSLYIEYCPTTTNQAQYTSGAITNICLAGAATMSGVKVTVSGQTVDTTKFFTPVSSRQRIFVLNGATFSNSYSVKFLKGSQMTILQGGRLNVNAPLIFYTKQAVTLSNTSSPEASSSAADAKLINNGTIFVNQDGSGKGAIGAVIQHTASSQGQAVVNLSSATSGALSVSAVEDADGKTVTIKSTATFIFDDNAHSEGTLVGEFSLTKTYTSGYDNDVDPNYFWVGEFVATVKVSVTLAASTYSYPLKTYTLYYNTSGSTSGQKALASSATTSQNFEIQAGLYIRLVSDDTAEKVIIVDDMTKTYSNSGWFRVLKGASITITPSKGVFVCIDTTGTSHQYWNGSKYITDESVDLGTTNNTDSGRGSTKVVIMTSATKSGTFSNVQSPTTGSASAILKEGIYFRVHCTTKGTTGNLASIEFSGSYYEYRVNGSGIASGSVKTGFDPYSSYQKFTYGTNTGDEKIVFTFGFRESSSSCLLPSSLITMADGSSKEIQHIEQGELILVFNHETGEFDVSPAMFNEVEEANIFNVIHLIFSDGSDIGVISEHGFFDLTTMRYEYIHEDNYQDYIGHEFYSLEGGRVMLLSAYVHEEYTAVYSMPTYYFLNSFTDGILSMPGATSYFSNIFAYAENLQYDQEAMAADIEQYGLLTLEDLAPYGVTEELFEAYAGKYLGIALAKGLITEEDLLYLIARYGGYYE